MRLSARAKAALVCASALARYAHCLRWRLAQPRSSCRASCWRLRAPGAPLPRQPLSPLQLPSRLGRKVSLSTCRSLALRQRSPAVPALTRGNPKVKLPAPGGLHGFVLHTHAAHSAAVGTHMRCLPKPLARAVRAGEVPARPAGRCRNFLGAAADEAGSKRARRHSDGESDAQLLVRQCSVPRPRGFCGPDDRVITSKTASIDLRRRCGGFVCAPSGHATGERVAPQDAAGFFLPDDRVQRLPCVP